MLRAGGQIVLTQFDLLMMSTELL